MGRLIDADELLKEMERERIHLFNKMHDGYLKAMKCVKRQPTAYNPDKVVEQLEKLPQYSTWNHNNDNISRKKAIEIVKGGGVDA